MPDPAVDARQLSEQARTAVEQGDRQLAEALLRESLDVDPENAAAHQQLANLLIADGQSHLAAEHLLVAMEQDPTEPQCHIELASLLMEQGRLREAGPVLEAALELDPRCPAALLLQGKLHLQQGQRGEALETLHRVLACDPDNIDARLEIAGIQLEESRPRQAAPLLRSVTVAQDATTEQRAAACWQLGIAYGAEERWVETVETLSDGMAARNAPVADDWYRLAYARYRSGDASGAVQDLGTVLQIDPAHQDARAMMSALRVPVADRSGITRVNFSLRNIPVPAGWQPPAAGRSPEHGFRTIPASP